MDDLLTYVCCGSVLLLGLLITTFIILLVLASKRKKKIIAENGEIVEAEITGVKYYCARKHYRVLAYFKNPHTGQEHTYKSHNSFSRKPKVRKGDKVKIKVYLKNSKYYSFKYKD